MHNEACCTQQVGTLMFFPHDSSSSGALYALAASASFKRIQALF